MPGAFNPQAWDRFGYVFNNPLIFKDPSGNKPCGAWDGNGNCTLTEEPGWQSESPYTVENVCGNSALSLQGEAVCRDYFRLYETKGWWNANGYLTPEQFLGLMLIYERSGYAGAEEWLKEAAKNQLWMNTPEHEAYCQGTTCETSEIFNFMGAFMDPYNLAEGHITERVDSLIDPQLSPTAGPKLIRSIGEDWSNIMQKAAEWGAYVTGYDPSRVAYNKNVPYRWGNKEHVVTLLRRANPIFGPARDQIVYFISNFYIYTINQGSFWK